MENKKITVALIGECYGATGKGMYPVKISEFLEKVDDRFKVKLFIRDDAPYNSKNIITVNTFKTKVRLLSGLGYYIPLFLKLLKEREIDIIHAYDEKTSALASLLKKPLIATVPDITPLTHYKFPFNYFFKIVYSFLDKAGRIVAFSDSTRNKLIERYPALSKKTKTLYLGVNTNKFKPDAKKRNSKIINIGILGCLDQELWGAFEKILKEYEGKVKIILGGRPLPKELAHVKSHKDLIFKGFVEDSKLSEHYQEIDIFVYKNPVEGFGLIPLEAMSSGCAVISSNVDSLPEVVKDAGILVNNTTEEFYTAIKTLIDKKNLRLKYQKKGRKRAEELTWDKCAINHAKLYSEFVGKNYK